MQSFNFTIQSSDFTLQYLIKNLKISAYHFALLIGHWERWCQLQHIQSVINIDNVRFWRHLLQEIQQTSLYSTPEISKKTQISEEILMKIYHSNKVILSLRPVQIESLLELHKETRPDLLYCH